MTPPPERKIGSELTHALNQSTGSYELVIAAVAAAGFGYMIDRAFGLVPVFTIAFAVIGFVGAMISLWYRYQASMAVATADRAARAERGGSSA